MRWPAVRHLLMDQRADVRVLRLLVAPQVDLALECLVAQFAGKRFVAGVFARVRNQIGALAEGFAAHLALVGFLACGGGKMRKDSDQIRFGMMQRNRMLIGTQLIRPNNST